MYAEVQSYGQSSLISQHAALVKRIAFHLVNRLPPSVQVDDLIQAGMVGLLEAASNFDASQGASFETYAGIRIRGSMLDEIRRSDWTPRSVHRKSRQVSEVIHKLENELGRDPSDQEIAADLGIKLADYHQILVDSNSARVFSMDALAEDGDTFSGSADESPYDSVSQQQYQRSLAESIQTLPQKEQLVMALYYDEELNFREIGQVLEVSESRVCQIHGQAVLRLRGKMRDWHVSD
jgi:RNA polymerase sigma factor for flagellar operon FliA